MTVVERRKELKSKARCVAICVGIQFIWIIPAMYKFDMNNRVLNTETESEVATETGTDTEVSIEDVETPSVSTELETEFGTDTETETEISTEVEKTYVVEWHGYEITQEEFELICTTVFCEAGGESFKEKYMVALTILNQITSGKFGGTVRTVIYKNNNFSVTKWKDFENRGWTSSVEEAVLLALKENPHPRNMYYFRTGHYHKWAKNYKKVGSIYFSTDK